MADLLSGICNSKFEVVFLLLSPLLPVSLLFYIVIVSLKGRRIDATYFLSPRDLWRSSQFELAIFKNIALPIIVFLGGVALYIGLMVAASEIYSKYSPCSAVVKYHCSTADALVSEFIEIDARSDSFRRMRDYVSQKRDDLNDHTYECSYMGREVRVE